MLSTKYLGSYITWDVISGCYSVLKRQLISAYQMGRELVLFSLLLLLSFHRTSLLPCTLKICVQFSFAVELQRTPDHPVLGFPHCSSVGFNTYSGFKVIFWILTLKLMENSQRELYIFNRTFTWKIASFLPCNSKTSSTMPTMMGPHLPGSY